MTPPKPRLPAGERSHTTLTTDDGFAVLTLNRPEVRNALTDTEMLWEIIEVFENPPERVLVLTGAGSAFSAGGNVRDMAAGTGMFSGSVGEVAENYRRTIQRLTRAVAHTEAVTVAAVNGPAIGAGFDLVLGCDLRLGSEDAWFAHTFVDLGIIPGDGGAWLLPRVVGWQAATEIALTARRVKAMEAVDLDILLRVVEPERLMEESRALAAEIASKPRHSVRYTKRLLRHARTMDLEGFLEFSAALQALSHAEPEHAEAVARYLERWRS